MSVSEEEVANVSSLFYALSITIIPTPTAEVVMSVCYVVVKATTM